MNSCHDQGIVAYMLYIQAFATEINVCDWQSVLITSLFPSEALEDLIFKGSKVKLQLCVLDPLILAVQRSPGSAPQKDFDRFIQFDPGHKRFYLGNISD